MSDKIKVTINRSKWRTGLAYEIATGPGFTELLNPSGGQCCLGFICEATGVPRTRLLHLKKPSELMAEVDGLVDRCDGDYEDTELTNKAIDINDGDLDPSEKEQKLLELFKNSPYELEFVGEYNWRHKK